jgi:DNA-binding transcriptional ArsR family regulator
MNVESIVPVFKALADPLRLRLVGSIADGERCNAELAAELGVTPATVSHHLKVLREAGLLRERREAPYIYVELDHEALRQAVMTVADRKSTRTLTAAGDQRGKVIETFFDGDTLRAIPAKRSKKEIIFEEILRRLPAPRSDGSYTERQLSKLIERHHSDFCTIRREFIMGRYMTRDRGRYRLTPKGEAVVARD